MIMISYTPFLRGWPRGMPALSMLVTYFSTLPTDVVFSLSNLSYSFFYACNQSQYPTPAHPKATATATGDCARNDVVRRGR